MLENIYYIGQTVAVLAILISLLFLAYQGRQAQKQIEQTNAIAQAQLSKGSVDYFTAMTRSFLETPEDSAFMNKAFYTMEPLSEFEQDLFISRMGSMINQALVSTELAEQGLMSKETFTTGQGFMDGILAWPRPRKYWSVYRSTAGADSALADHFDQRVQSSKDIPRVTPLDLFDVNTPLPEDLSEASDASTL